jgi:DNA helicase HerA-like ATPase
MPLKTQICNRLVTALTQRESSPISRAAISAFTRSARRPATKRTALHAGALSKQERREGVINVILAHAAERFRSNLTPHRIQIFLEEAHRLFDRDRFADRLAANDPYVWLAREAGKYRIGMVYSTQQVSSVEPDVLGNTANWIVAHLNSETEVKLLRGRYEFDRFGDQIRHAEDVGFVRLKTQSSRFVIPIQVRLFDYAMVEAAKKAEPVLSGEEA